MNDTELLIHPRSSRRWEVVERPANNDRPDWSEIKVLHTTTTKQLALTWAEGRQSVSGQPIRLSSGV